MNILDKIVLTLIMLAGLIFGVAVFVEHESPESPSAPSGSSAPSDPPCYFVIDRMGREYASYYPPEAGDIGMYYTTDHEWGIVFAPNATRVDRDCLRARGVEVPPVKQQEEAP